MSNTVLIVDDAEFMRVMLKDILYEMGLNVIGEAGDGREAVRQFRKLQPDLVAMDITMPRMDGIAALKKIKAEAPDALVVMITALGQKEKVLESIQAGAQDFIVKPFDQERVQTTIGRLLAKAVA
ncbi:MAG: response regulator [bacterium]